MPNIPIDSRKYSLLFLMILFLTVSCKQSVVKRLSKVVKTTDNVLIRSTVKETEDQLIEKEITIISKLILKNGLAKTLKINSNKDVQYILKRTYKLRGKKEFDKVLAKLNLYKGKVVQANQIKGFLAEELTHNELIIVDGISSIRKSVKGSVTSKMLKRQQFIDSKFFNRINPAKKYELDLVFSKGGIQSAIEVKNYNGFISNKRFVSIKTQLLKQRSVCDEIGIKNLFWSNVGEAKLSKEQIKELDKIGVQVFQHGSTSPIINAKVNNLLIKSRI